MLDEYVSFITAMLLKEKGFDEECVTTYAQHPAHEEPIVMWNDAATNSKGVFGAVFHCYASAPTQAVALRWLRESHKIYVDVKTITPEAEEPYFFIYLRQINSDGHQFRDYAPQDKYPSYEEAVEASLKWVLEHWFGVQP